MADNIDNLSLEKLIKEVDYKSLEQGYIPSKFAIEFISFIKLVCGGKEENTALALDTPLLTPYGFKLMEDVQVNDFVLDRDGIPSKVLKISPIFGNTTYTITLANGESFIANEDHLHILERRLPGNKGFIEEVISTKDLVTNGYTSPHKVTPKHRKGYTYKYFIPTIKKPLEFGIRDSYHIDPYTVGLVLGDGNAQEVSNLLTISTHEDDAEELRSYIPYRTGPLRDYKVCSKAKKFYIYDVGSLYKATTAKFGISKMDKYIPDELLFGTIEDRLEVLRGLMDADGTINEKNLCSIHLACANLAYGVKHIVKSLGGYASIDWYKSSGEHPKSNRGYYKVCVHLSNFNPFKLKRKADKWIPDKLCRTGKRIAIDTIVKTATPVPSKCITVDSPTQSYLIDGCLMTHNSPLFHFKMLDNIQRFMYNLIVSFRGSAKSSLLTEYLVLYLAVYGTLPNFGEINVALAVFDSMDNGAKNLRNNIEHRYDNSSFLQKWIKKTRFTDNKLEFTNVEGKQFCIRLFGVLTGVRGFKEYGERPTIALIDDIFSTKAAESDTVTKDIEDTIYKAVMPALHPTHKKIIWVGTPMSKKDPLYKAAGTSAWKTLTFPICEKFPCTKSEFVGAWEDRFSYDAVKAQYDMYKGTGRIDAFNQELMLRILSDDDRLVLDEDIIWYKRNDVLDNKQNYNFYITTDFATSEKESADFSVISVWALDYKGVFHWVDGIAVRQDMSKNVDDLFRLAKIYDPLSTGIEISGQQKGFVSWIQRDMQIRGQWFTLASDKVGREVGLRPTTNKLTRFNAALPLFKQRLMAFPIELQESPIMLEFMDELFSVTPSGSKSLHDDCLDSVSQLQMLEYFRPGDPNYVPDTPTKKAYNKYFDSAPEVEEIDSYIV